MSSLLSNAKRLRKEATDTERHLWKYLRAKRLGFKFRRQVVIGPYIVDFVCHDRRLVIECDGGQHASQKSYDQKRDQWLQKQGYRVLRFWDNEVLQNLDAVLERILVCCQDHPLPIPLPPKVFNPIEGEGVSP